MRFETWWSTGQIVIYKNVTIQKMLNSIDYYPEIEIKKVKIKVKLKLVEPS